MFHILQAAFFELQFNFCLVINFCVCSISLCVSLRAGTLSHRDNGLVFSVTEETQRRHRHTLGWGRGCDVSRLFSHRSKPSPVSFPQPPVPCSLLKIGSPFQHSELKLTCLETFLFLTQPNVVTALHSLFSPLLVIFLFNLKNQNPLP